MTEMAQIRRALRLAYPFLAIGGLYYDNIKDCFVAVPDKHNPVDELERPREFNREGGDGTVWVTA